MNKGMLFGKKVKSKEVLSLSRLISKQHKEASIDKQYYVRWNNKEEDGVSAHFSIIII